MYMCMYICIYVLYYIILYELIVIYNNMRYFRYCRLWRRVVHNNKSSSAVCSNTHTHTHTLSQLDIMVHRCVIFGQRTGCWKSWELSRSMAYYIYMYIYIYNILNYIQSNSLSTLILFPQYFRFLIISLFKSRDI
jgi:hypothetical protein